MQRLPENLKKKISVNEKSGCWIWTGAISSKRFGIVKLNNKTWKASRLVYTLLVKPIEDGMYILHSCDDPLCVNPQHLREGTQKENMEDMYFRKRNVHNPPIGESHPNSKLTTEDIIKIKLDPRPQTAIARDFGVVQQTISDIKTGRIWKHIKESEE